MNVVRKPFPSEKARIQLKTLKSAVEKTLERKRRLGQYVVIWKDGKAVMLASSLLSLIQPKTQHCAQDNPEQQERGA